MDKSVFDDDDEVEEMLRTSPVSESTQEAIDFALRNSGLSNNALGAFVRWHQLETWLRQLAYVELRAKYGVDWESEVGKGSIGRMEKDRAYPYMASPDLENPLAYLDASKLFDLVEAEWTLFDPVLVDRDIWTGRRAELVKIRHRIGHMRRPHGDDVRRLEQTLRDLEQGAFAAIASYNRAVSFSMLNDGKDNPVFQGWVERKHDDARRLIDHAAETRNIHFGIELTKRPWADPKETPNTDRQSGLLWRVDFHLPDRYVRLHQLWRDNRFRRTALDVLLHLHYNDPSHVAFTFPVVDDPQSVANAIGDTFEAVLTNSSILTSEGPANFELPSVRVGGNTRSDFRILIDSPWNVIDESMPVTLFGAQPLC